MTTIAATNPTLMDIAKLTEPDGGITNDVAEMLTQQNEMLMDATWQEANGATFDRVSIRTGIPEPTWRAFYQGVQPSKNSYAQVDEPLGMMEARSVVDKKLGDMSPDLAKFRLTEAYGFIEGMSQSLAATSLYGSVSTSPAKFNGFMPRLNSLSAASGENVVDGGGTGNDNTSILIVSWSPRTVWFSFPRGSKAGIIREDLGVNNNAVPPDGSSGVYSAYEEKFQQDAGLVVKDWRHVVRIANIDVSNLVAESSAADLLKLLAIGIEKIPAGGRIAIYCNRTIKTMMRIQAMNKTNVYLSIDRPEGKSIVTFDGYPFRRMDQLLNTEARVV